MDAQMTRDVRVVTYNIHRGIGADGRLDLERTADVIDRCDPDLVGLQEVDREFRSTTAFEDQLAVLGDRLGLETAFGAALERSSRDADDGQPGRYGVAVLSRGSIVDSSVVTLPFDANDERRVLLKTDVELDGGPEIVFCSTHLGLSAGTRERQAATIVDAIDGSSPVVLVGDFNATPGSPPLESLTGRFDDVFERADRSDTPTYPSPYVEPADGPGQYSVAVPDRRIDHVLSTPEISVGEVEVIESLASDHSLVFARLSIPE